MSWLKLCWNVDTMMLLWVGYKCCLQQFSGSWERYSALGNTRNFLRALLACSFLQLKQTSGHNNILLFAWYVRDYTCSIEITCSDHIYSFVPAATLLFTMKMKGVTSNSARCKLIKNSCTHIQQSIQPTPTSNELPPSNCIAHARCLSPWTMWLHVFSGFTIAVLSRDSWRKRHCIVELSAEKDVAKRQRLILQILCVHICITI